MSDVVTDALTDPLGFIKRMNMEKRAISLFYENKGRFAHPWSWESQSDYEKDGWRELAEKELPK